MLRTIAVMSLLALSAPALAEGPEWNFIQGGWQRVDIDASGSSVDGDGFGIGGAFEIGSSWHFIGSYQTADFDFSVDLNQLIIGGGFHTALTPTTDFVADIAYTRLDASAGVVPLSIDDDGFIARIGVRSMLTNQFELAGFVAQTELDDSGGDTSVAGEAWYNITDAFAVGLIVELGDDVTRWGAAARLYFGN